MERAWYRRSLATHSIAPDQGRGLQRKCACGGECADCRKKDEAVQRSPLSSPRRRLHPDGSPKVEDVVRSPGRPLDAASRMLAESSFGHDFSHVRIHTDAQAAASAESLHAAAYTAGTHVVFGSGRYRPDAASGRRLLAHELVHVVQQTDGGTSNTSGLSHPFDSSEREADRIAEEAVQAPNMTSPARDERALLPGSSLDDRAIRRAVDENSEAAPRGDAEQGIEVDPDELMLLPRWSIALSPPPGSDPGDGAPDPLLVQRQKAADAGHCDSPSGMRKVTSGKFEGGKTLDDYFPDIVGTNSWGSRDTAGPFDNGTRAGSAVQLIGELPIPCATSDKPTTLGQSITLVRFRVDGKQVKEGGKALEGQTIDDIKRSGRDQSKAPFRQSWLGVVTMADPISGVPYSGLKSYVLEANATSSLTGAGGTASVNWGITIEATAGKVTKNEVR